jgi:putative ABC transport system permease protein
VLGSVLFRLVVALVFWLGLGTTDLKLFTALFVFAALVVPEYLRKIRSGKHHQAAT